MYVCHMCVWCLWRSAERNRSLELVFQMVVSTVECGTRIRILCKSSKCFKLLNHLSGQHLSF